MKEIKTKNFSVSIQYSPITGWENSPIFWRRWHSPGFWRVTKKMWGFKLFNWTIFLIIK